MKKLNAKQHLIVFVFIVALIAHLVGLNKVGRTWDESYSTDWGWIAWDRLVHGDFKLGSWSFATEHPMVAKYVYGAALLPHMIPTNSQGQILVSQFDRARERSLVPTNLMGQMWLVDYDYTVPRLASAVFNSVTVTLTYVYALQFVSRYIGLAAPAALLLTPRFVAMGQLVTFESLSVFLLMLLVFAFKHRKFGLIGLLSALLVWTRYNNVYALVLIAGLAIIERVFDRRWWLVPAMIFVVGMLTWPLLWHEFPRYLIESVTFHQAKTIGPSLYFVEQFLYTTPAIFLVLMLIGLFNAKLELWWWFLSVFGVFSIFSFKMGSTRYIFYIYPVYAVLVSLGVYRLLIFGKKFFRKRQWALVVLATIMLVYQLIQVNSVYPYYLDYYNELVGGVKGAADKNWLISWWGEGQKEVGLWLNNKTEKQSSVALMVTPKYVFPPLRRDIKLFPYFEGVGESDYLVVSRLDMHKLTEEIRKDYSQVYQAEAQGVGLVYVFKKNKL